MLSKTLLAFDPEVYFVNRPRPTINLIQNGWTPSLSMVKHKGKVLHKVEDWTGGFGDKPDTNYYLGATGYTINPDLATNIYPTLAISDVSEFSTLTNEAGTVAQLTDVLRGGVFEYKATGYTVDNGIVFAADTTGYWVRQYEDVIRPEWFGAKGDGVTDDTDALNATLLSARNISVAYGGSTVSLKGTYLVSEPVMITADSNITIQGRSKIKRAPGVTGSIVRILGNIDNPTASVTLRDIEIDGNALADPSAWNFSRQNGVHKELTIANNVYGIYADNINFITLDNCKFHDIHGSGVYTRKVRHASIRNSVFKNIAGRAAIDSNSTLTSCVVLDNWFENIGVLPNEFTVITDGVSATGLINDANRYSHQFGDGVLDAALRSNVHANTFINCNRLAVTRDIANDQGIMNASASITDNYILHNSPNLVNSNPPASIWVEHSKSAIITGNTIEFVQRGREQIAGVTAIRFLESKQDSMNGVIANNQIIADNFVDYAGASQAVYAGIFSNNIQSNSKVGIHNNQITGRILDGIYIGNSSVSNINTVYNVSHNIIDLFPPASFECSALKVVASFQIADGFPKIKSSYNNYRINTDNEAVWATLSYKRCVSVSDNMPFPLEMSMENDSVNYGSIYLGNNVKSFTIKDISDIRTVAASPFSAYVLLSGIEIKNCKIKEVFLPKVVDTEICNNKLVSVKINACDNFDFAGNTIDVDKFNAYSVTFDTANGDFYNAIIANNRFKYVGNGARFGIELKRTNTAYQYATVQISNNIHKGNGQSGSVGMKTFGLLSAGGYTFFDKQGNIYMHLATAEEGF